MKSLQSLCSQMEKGDIVVFIFSDVRRLGASMVIENGSA